LKPDFILWNLLPSDAVTHSNASCCALCEHANYLLNVHIFEDVVPGVVLGVVVTLCLQYTPAQVLLMTSHLVNHSKHLLCRRGTYLCVFCSWDSGFVINIQ